MRVSSLLVLLTACAVHAVDRSKFRTCAQTGFCARHRDRPPLAPFTVSSPESIQLDAGIVRATLQQGDAHPLALSLEALSSGVLRVRIVETSRDGLAPRYEPPDVLVGADALAALRDPLEIQSRSASELRVRSASGRVAARVQLSPLKIQVMDASDRVAAVLNGEGLMHFEQRGAQSGQTAASASSNTGGAGSADGGKAEREVIDWGEDGKPIYADGDNDDDSDASESADASDATPPPTTDAGAPESFGGHTDAKPHGPMSVGMDSAFPDCAHLFGLPEHATDFNIKSTRGGGHDAYTEPFRNYNLDVFEYELNEPMALYGHIPIAVCHGRAGTAAVFWNNPSETFVDVSDAPGPVREKRVRWISESGVVDAMVFVGPAPRDVFAQTASVTGVTPVPPLFALGYHQCRWNYRDEADVSDVHAQFEKLDLPYDVLWLDIEHTDGKRYFTWDKNKFPTPQKMQDALAAHARKMVTIVDPHIKRDASYPVHAEAERLGLYIKDKDGRADFKGWCWPGDSSYLDFTDARVRSWWADRFSLENYAGSTLSLHTWNDMNEPSVFNGPEVSMIKEARSLAGVEHREWHNLYGFYQHMATAEGLLRRSGDARLRPFVLSRSFFAGSQRHGAIWTGDNKADWAHLKVASHMLLSLGAAGLPFAGADVGGFFGNPDPELLTRWYQAGAFQPFFRAHAHIDTKRREPWLFGEEVLARLRGAIEQRYALLPLWYTLFREHERSGMPPMRPMWALAPEDEGGFAIGDQWAVGEALLVKPVTDAGARHVDVYLPRGTAWYQFAAPHAMRRGQGRPEREEAPMDKVPVFVRGGAVVPMKLRLRRSSQAMRNDPYSLLVALEPDLGTAEGSLYADDEESLAYTSGRASCDAKFQVSGGGAQLRASADCGAEFERALEVERVTMLGVKRAPKFARLEGAEEALGVVYDAATQVLTVRKPREGFMRVPFVLNVEF